MTEYTESENSAAKNENESTEQARSKVESLRESATPHIQKIWPQIRQLLVLQIKLWIDAMRDLLMMPVALVASIADIMLEKQGEDSYFQRVLALGRTTERKINLFSGFTEADDDETSVDSIIKKAEEKINNSI